MLLGLPLAINISLSLGKKVLLASFIRMVTLDISRLHDRLNCDVWYVHSKTEAKAREYHESGPERGRGVGL